MKKLTASALIVCLILTMTACSDNNSHKRNRRSSDDDDDSEETTTLEEESETSEETTTETTALTASYVDAYIEVINSEISESSDTTFGLIHIDDDDIPELVANKQGYWASIYMYKDGKVLKPMDVWGYGAGGNPGYDYVPYENTLFNTNADYAGLFRGFYLMEINSSGEIEVIHTGDMQYYEEGAEDPWNADCQLEEPIYHIEGQPATEEEFDKIFTVTGTQAIYGGLTAEETISILKSGDIPMEHTYEIVTKDVTWTEAEAYAENREGYLMTIDKPSEYYIAYSLINSDDISNNVVLIGASQDENGEYKWTTDGSNSPINDSYWLKGEPSFEGKTESGDTVKENRTAMFIVKDDYQLVMMDVPDDILSAAPSYSGHLSFIVEYEH